VFPSEAAYVDWCDTWLAEVRRALAPTGSAYVCGFSEILAEVKARSARRFADCRWLVWSVQATRPTSAATGAAPTSRSCTCAALRGRGIDVDAVRIPYNAHTTKLPRARPGRVVAVRPRRAPRSSWEPHPGGAKPRDVFDLPVLSNGTAEKTAHATQKPEALIEKFILASSAPGELVVDPFVGSGTTAVVAARLGRRFLCGDADARYVGLARTRLGG
jgi:site-specific DNA-methyltransferase (adenine-specific)